MKLFVILGLLGSLLFCLYVMTWHKTVLEPAVDSFHKKYNIGQFEAIWDEAHPKKGSMFQSKDLQNAFKTKENFKNYLQSAQNRLGKMVSSSRLSSEQIEKFSYTEKQSVVQRTVFEKGEGTESFIFEIIDHKPVLVGYELR